jgi:hypothetical protein
MSNESRRESEPRLNNVPVRVFVMLAAVLVATTLPRSEAQSAQPLAAPTFYIAASGEYSTYSPTVRVRGASNVPPGSKLTVSLYDFIGDKSSILSEEAVVTLSERGLFEVTLRPREGKTFKANMVCVILFDPQGAVVRETTVLPQAPAVVKITGKNGESLGIGTNPQIGKNSAGYYLQALVQIP